MRFEQSSYEITEDANEVIVVILLSQPSSKPFDVTISLMNLTAECK